MNKKYVGGSFDDFLSANGILEESDAVAVKRVLAWNLEQKMARENLTLSGVADDLGTSRAAINRIFDAGNTSITLNTIEKVAMYVGKRVRLMLV